MTADNEPAGFFVPLNAEDAPAAIAEALGGPRLALVWLAVAIHEARRSLNGIGSVGMAYAEAREGSPEGFYALGCVTCGATWTGEEGESCPWCARRLEDARQRAERSRS